MQVHTLSQVTRVHTSLQVTQIRNSSRSHVIQIHTLSEVTKEYPSSQHRQHRYTPRHIAGDTGTYLVTGDTRWQVEQMHHFKNERHQTEYVGICQQLHKCPLIVLADAIVYPKHMLNITVQDATNNFRFNQPLF